MCVVLCHNLDRVRVDAYFLRRLAEFKGAFILTLKSLMLAPIWQAIDSKVTGVTAHFVHFAELSAALNAAESQILDRLLTYGPKPTDQVSSLRIV